MEGRMEGWKDGRKEGRSYAFQLFADAASVEVSVAGSDAALTGQHFEGGRLAAIVDAQ